MFVALKFDSSDQRLPKRLCRLLMVRLAVILRHFDETMAALFRRVLSHLYHRPFSQIPDLFGLQFLPLKKNYLHLQGLVFLNSTLGKSE